MQNQVLLDLAYKAIEDELKGVESIDRVDCQSEFSFLKDERASFVTLTLNERLRGCMGSLEPHRKLIDDVISNAKAAAVKDYRFQPLSLNELEHVEIEISLLSVPKILIYQSVEELEEKIKIGKDGVILRQNNNQVTFLPQVWEQLPIFEHFFNHLCQKAGLHIDCLHHCPEIYTYQVEKIKG